MDSKRHKHFTGVGNEGILNNYLNLLKNKKTVVTRVPVIPGVNNYKENFESLRNAGRLASCGATCVWPGGYRIGRESLPGDRPCRGYDLRRNVIHRN